MSSPGFRTPSSKRSSLAADLEQEPETSSARRALKSDLFSSRMATKSLERRTIVAENAKAQLECELKEKEIVIERLGKERLWLAERETAEQEEKTRFMAEWAKEKKELERTVRSLRSKVSELEQSSGDMEDENAELKRSTSSTIADQKAQALRLERQVAMLHEELSRTQELAQQQKDTARGLREQLETLELEPRRSERKRDDDSWQTVRDELERQSTYIKSVENANLKLTAENQRLRAKHENAELLRVEKLRLQKKVAEGAGQEVKIAQLEAELNVARKELQQWSAFNTTSGPESSSTTPASLTHVVSKLRVEVSDLLQQRASLSEAAKHRDQELHALRTAASASSTSVEDLTKRLSETEARLTRRDKRIRQAEQEVAGLNALLETYRAEKKQPTRDDGDTTLDEEASSLRIQQLESRVEELQEVVSELEQALEEARRQPAPHSANLDVEMNEGNTARVAELEEELAETTKALDMSQDRIADLEQQLFEVGATVNAGNHVPPHTRVLQFSLNPVRQDVDLKKEVFERLSQENNALLQRLREVEEGLSVPGDARTVPRESWENLQMAKEDMQKLVAEKEKRLLRLKQVYTAKTEEFRQTVSNILGYTLFFQPTKIRLTSTYNVAAAMTFQLNTAARDGATMKLLGAGNGEDALLTNQMNELIQRWIVERDSVPCFMAALTLACYERAHAAAEDTSMVNSATESGMMLTETVG